MTIPGVPRSELRWLARQARREGKQLARRVRRGQLTRADIEAAAVEFPLDAEPKIALAWLDRWGIKRAAPRLAELRECPRCGGYVPLGALHDCRPPLGPPPGMLY